MFEVTCLYIYSQSPDGSTKRAVTLGLKLIICRVVSAEAVGATLSEVFLS